MWCLVCVAVVACSSASDPAPPAPSGSGAVVQKFVDELGLADRAGELRVRGVVEGPLYAVGDDRDTRVIAFGLRHGKQHIRVVATGVLPIAFREGADAIVVGRFLNADQLEESVKAHALTETGELFSARDVLAFRPSY